MSRFVCVLVATDDESLELVQDNKVGPQRRDACPAEDRSELGDDRPAALARILVGISVLLAAGQGEGAFPQSRATGLPLKGLEAIELP